MTDILLASLLAALLQSSPQATPDPAPYAPPVTLSQENTALLRCSAAFALVSYGQERGEESAMSWPTLDPRGREFFVRALAKIIDDTGQSRDDVAQWAQVEAQRLLDQGEVDQVMPACLAMLEASGI